MHRDKAHICTSILVISIGYMVAFSAQAQDSPKATKPPISIELAAYVEFATETKDDISEQLSTIEQTPAKIHQKYSQAIQDLQTMVDATNNGDFSAARKIFQKVMRAFTAISVFIATSQNGEEEISGEKLEKAVKNLFVRMQKRISKLRRVDSKSSLGTDFRQIETWVDRAQKADSKNDIERLRTCLLELKSAIIQVEDYVSERLALISDD